MKMASPNVSIISVCAPFLKIKWILILLLSILSNSKVQAQQLNRSKLNEGSQLISNLEKVACNEAGTITFGEFIGQSNDINPDTIFLCFGDSLFIDHDGNQDLSGDPNPGTFPGIGYAFYYCKPTVDGPDIATIVTDPCVNQGSVTTVLEDGLLVATGEINGDIWFFNTGQIPQFFNSNCESFQFWFAPITIDDFGSTGYENSGSCVDVNVDEAFSVVYLSEIQVDNINPNIGGNGCFGSFQVSGGLPEYDPTTYYQISIINGEIITPGDISHGDIIQFRRFGNGEVALRIEDGKSCETIFPIPNQVCSMIEFHTQGTLGQMGLSCLGVTAENFNDVAQIQVQAGISDAQLIPDSVFINSIFQGAEIEVIPEQNQIIFTYDSNIGVSLDENEPLFTYCYYPTGLDIIASQGSTGSVFDSNGFEILAVSTSEPVGVASTPFVQSLSVSPISCFGANNGSITAMGSSEGPESGFPYVFIIVPNISPTSTTDSTATWENLSPGEYIIRFDANGGTQEGSFAQVVTVLDPEALELSIDTSNPDCLGEASGSIEIDILNGSSPYFINWSGPSSGAEANTFPNFLIPELNSGNYVINITDGQGCTKDTTIIIEDGIGPTGQSININACVDEQVSLGSFFNFENFAENLSFNWSPSDQLSCSDCPNPIFSTSNSGIYDIEVMIMGQTCQFTEQISLVIVKVPASFPQTVQACLNESIELNSFLGGGQNIIWSTDPLGNNIIGTGPSIIVLVEEGVTYYSLLEGVCQEPVVEEVVIEIPVNNDSLALVSVYEAFGGASWTNTWDLSQPIQTWFGVTVSCDLIELNLSNNNLVGDIGQLGSIDFPDLLKLDLSQNNLTGNTPDLNNIPNLKELYLNDNTLTACPALSPVLTSLDLSNNALTFDDILPNIAVPDFNYAPQAEISLMPNTADITEADNYSLELGIDEGILSNNYVWLKDGSFYVLIQGRNELDYYSVGVDDIGAYRCLISNENAPDLVLRSENFELNVDPSETAFVEIVSADIDSFLNIGDTFCMDFSVTGFDDITNLEYSMSWDTNVLELINYEVVNTIFSEGLISEVNSEAGQIGFNWNSGRFCDGFSFPENKVLYQLCFELKREECFNTFIEFGTEPQPLNIISPNAQIQFDIGEKVRYSNLCDLLLDIPGYAFYTAEEEFTDSTSWTNYLKLTTIENTPDTVLLSINKRDRDIGTVGDGLFNIEVFKDTGVIVLSDLPNFDAFVPENEAWVALNYHWFVNPNFATASDQLEQDFGLRFFFTQEDLNTLRNHFNDMAIDTSDLVFYKFGDTTDVNLCETYQNVDLEDIKLFEYGSNPSETNWAIIGNIGNNNSLISEMCIDGFSCGGIMVRRMITDVNELEVSSISGLNIYPNPVQVVLQGHFYSSRKESAWIEIYNALGQLINQQEIQVNTGKNNFKFNAKFLTDGVYFLSLRDDQDQKFTRRFVKQ